MGYFMLGTYAVLSLLAWFLALQGASLLEVLSIFIYPTGLFAFYLYLLCPGFPKWHHMPGSPRYDSIGRRSGPVL